jgi:hypothetical protein
MRLVTTLVAILVISAPMGGCLWDGGDSEVVNEEEFSFGCLNRMLKE